MLKDKQMQISIDSTHTKSAPVKAASTCFVYRSLSFDLLDNGFHKKGVWTDGKPWIPWP